MSAQGSITQWVFQLAAGDDQAAWEIWETYFEQLVQVARRQLRGRQWGGVDEEDVALSALDSFIGRRAEGGFSALHRRD